MHEIVSLRQRTDRRWLSACPYSAVPAEGGAVLAAEAPAQSDAVRAETRLPAAGVLDELTSALASARAALSNFLDLMPLEARRAGLALMWMVAWGFVAAGSLIVILLWVYYSSQIVFVGTEFTCVY